MAVTVAELVAKVRAETSDLTKPLGDAQKQMTDFRKEVTSTGNALKQEMAGGSKAAGDSLSALKREMAEVTAGLGAQMAGLSTGTSGATSALGALRGMAGGALLAVSLLTAGISLLVAGVNTVTAAMTDQLERSRELQATTGLNAQQAVALGN